jgi:DNA-binding LacI/PurR family transcriptional regulator
MAKAVRLADVARAAGVSQGTASNVFSRPEIVRAEVRERVEACARKLGYAGPDPKGRLLRAGKVNAIGVVVMDDLAYFFSDPFNREFMRGVAEVCDQRGAGLALVSAMDRAKAAWTINSAVVDGFIVQCIEDGDRLLELTRKRGLPFVAVDIDSGPDANSIRIDDREGARLAAEHLLALGHRRFGILSLEIASDGRTGPVDRARRASAEYGATRDRLLGYQDAFAALGIDIDDVPTIEALNDRSGAAAGAEALLDRAPDVTAILTMSDVLALAVLDEARSRGLRVPADLSVVGYDDVPEAAGASPPLTTIAQPIVEKGRLAAHMIFDRGPPRREVLPVKLIVRGTTAAPRQDSPAR